jgi:hypothetical protein
MPVATRRQFFRLNPRRYPDPAFFSRGALHRFDAPGGSFGVCYLGTTLDCCLLEVLLPRRHPGTTARVLTLAQLRHHNGLYSVALFERARNKVAFDRWGPLGDRRHRGLWSETGRALQRFGIGVTR